MNEQVALKTLAKSAKNRIKKGFWRDCKQQIDEKLEQARLQGINESKASRYFLGQVTATLSGEKEDEFYLRVKNMLLEHGEVSDAIGRLTDKEYYESLSYAEKQRYTLALSERYLRALERFRRENEFLVVNR